MIKTIGILTSGGDAPGMNAAVVSVARCANVLGIKLVGIKRGYNGVLLKESKFDMSKINGPEDLTAEDWKALEPDITELNLETVLDIADQRGTFLRTARCMEFVELDYQRRGAENLRKLGIDALVVIGGDGSFCGARALYQQGIHCVCIPGTIDNDLGYTESTLGYDTAVNVCVEAVRSIRATSRSHDRPAVVQVMGRHCGDIGIRTAIATGAEMVIVPEMEWDIDTYAKRLNELVAKGNTRATLIICENCFAKMKPFDWRKFLNENGKHVHEAEELDANYLASILKRKCNGLEARATVIGYTQRGAVPNAFDSALAFQCGHYAVQLLNKGITNHCIGLRHGEVFSMPIDEALVAKKTFNREMYDLINSL